MTAAKRMRRAATSVERGVAAELGGKRTFLSGSGSDKADVVVRSEVTLDSSGQPHYSGPSLRVEAKMTGKRSYSLSSETYARTVDAAPHETTVLHILMQRSTWGVVDYNIFAPLAGVDLEPIRVGARSFTMKPYPVGPTDYEQQRKLSTRIVLTFGKYPLRHFDVLILPWELFLLARKGLI